MTERYPVTVAEQALAARCARGKVVVIDDDSETLAALTALIELEGYACEPYERAATYLQALRDHRRSFAGPTCVLCDVKMPELDGLAFQQRLLAAGDTPLLLMSGASGAMEVASAFRAGAVDFLIKPMDADELLSAVAKALALSTHRRLQRARAINLATRISGLTAREREVAHHVAQGMTNPAIASQLGIGLRTVKLYRQNAMEKLGASTIADLVRLANEGDL